MKPWVFGRGRAARGVQVLDVGRMEYGECLALQLRLRDQRIRGEGEDTLIVVEHPPVATLGRRGDPKEVFDPTLPVFAIDRGGKATYHGPGQLVLYPIVHLGENNRDVRAWVVHLENLVVRLLADFGVAAKPRLDAPGVWTEGSGKKIASIGIAIQGWVSTHGIALNVDLDLREFERIDPCGLGAAVMTSMKAEGATATMAEAKTWVHRHAATHLAGFRAFDATVSL
ncbi:MAG: lipoyl(octanoyl) transferase [Thermoplasmata archaeon]|jgi:lipoyl(octanoyl) transferase|nr:lipoyl(octanoyl) transferase [Thermoplasmata archaeon]